MEALFAIALGVVTACGVYLLLRGRTFPLVLGLSLLSYAANVFIFTMGRLAVNSPPIVAADAAGYADPLPQALVLTAIVIGFGMTGFIMELALRTARETGTDHVDARGGEDKVPADRRATRVERETRKGVP
jgi:multicomponent K+:H+ antiporter subunit C